MLLSDNGVGNVIIRVKTWIVVIYPIQRNSSSLRLKFKAAASHTDWL
jgi:hypothetical protein